MTKTNSNNTPEYQEHAGIKYHIIGSGSKGNSVVIGDVMVDCGLAFKKLQPYLYDIKYLLITHSHGDHVKETTLNRIKKMFPKITIISNYEVHQLYGVDIVANTNIPVVTRHYTFLPFHVKHDVYCFGYRFNMNDQEIVYVTDAAELPEFDEDYRVDMFFLESNHDPVKVAQAARYGRHSFHAIHGSSRHLSHDQAKAFYYMHRRDRDSFWEELHKSEKFY